MLASWAEQNVDPSLFSRELMANASYFVEDVEVCDFDMHHDGCNVVIIKLKICMGVVWINLYEYMHGSSLLA